MASDTRIALQVLVVVVFIQYEVLCGFSTKTATFCRDSWIYNMSYEDFEVYSCSKCYVQVFMNEKPLKIMFPPTYPYLLYSNMSDPNATVYYPDADSDQSEVCAYSLTDGECQMWKDCCHAAKYCCHTTQQQDYHQDACPATWDGITCWKETPADHTEEQPCPYYYVHSHMTWAKPQVSRKCLHNSTWQTHQDTQSEYSDYRECFDQTPTLEILRISLYIDFTGNAVSIVFLATAIGFILGFRELRNDLRNKRALKIHFNLFISVLCSAVFSVAFFSIYHDAFTSTEPVYKDNSIWCRSLNILTKYFKSTTYMCMFCEGLFLYRRISTPMKMGNTSILKYIIISWGLPAVTISIYVIVMVTTGHNERCWFDDNGPSNYEFIHMIPNLCSLLCNLGFLVSIQYKICKNSSKKSDTFTLESKLETFGHAIRATMSVTPIFGIQFLFLIYRPTNWPPYEIIVAIIESTQGALVAIVYCFTTNEVKSAVKHTKCCKRGHGYNRNGYMPTNPCVDVNTDNLTFRNRTSAQDPVVHNELPASTTKTLEREVTETEVYLELITTRSDSSMSRNTHTTTSGIGDSEHSINSQPNTVSSANRCITNCIDEQEDTRDYVDTLPRANHVSYLD